MASPSANLQHGFTTASQHDGDIADVSETCPFRRGPIGSTPPWFILGHPAAAIMVFRQMRDQSFQGLSIVKAPRSRKRHHKEIPALSDQLDIRFGGKGRIGHHDDHLRPGRALKTHQHPAQ
jgi:hypothetical protein